jgi:hypothetical protein
VFASGSSIAAARVAVVAARVRRDAPRLNAAELAAALVGTAKPAGQLLSAGAGRPDPAAAARAPAIAEPRMLAFKPPPAERVATVTLVNPGRRPAELRLSAALDSGLRAVPSLRRIRLRPGAAERVTVRLEGRPTRRSGFATGRLEAGPITVPMLVPLAAPPPPRLGKPTTVMRDGQPSGVRFSLGAVDRGDAGIAVEPVGSLRLVMIDAQGKEARELTPPGGAPNLLPGDYSYTLPDAISDELDAGDYRFRVTAQGASGGSATAESPPFTIR